MIVSFNKVTHTQVNDWVRPFYNKMSHDDKELFLLSPNHCPGGCLYYFIKCDENIVGYFCIDSHKTFYLKRMWIDYPYRNKGIGSKVLGEFDVTMLYCLDDMTDAQKFYEKNGFEAKHNSGYSLLYLR